MINKIKLLLFCVLYISSIGIFAEIYEHNDGIYIKSNDIEKPIFKPISNEDRKISYTLISKSKDDRWIIYSVINIRADHIGRISEPTYLYYVPLKKRISPDTYDADLFEIYNQGGREYLERENGEKVFLDILEKKILASSKYK